jgi:polysaccharide pyruvyl transferase WcaK-like protein
MIKTDRQSNLILFMTMMPKCALCSFVGKFRHLVKNRGKMEYYLPCLRDIKPTQNLVSKDGGLIIASYALYSIWFFIYDEARKVVLTRGAKEGMFTRTNLCNKQFRTMRTSK